MTEEQKETTDTPKTKLSHFTDIRQKYPHALVIGTIILSLIIGIIIGGFFSFGKGHTDFENKKHMMEKGKCRDGRGYDKKDMYNDTKEYRNTKTNNNDEPSSVPLIKNESNIAPQATIESKIISPNAPVLTGTGQKK